MYERKKEQSTLWKYCEEKHDGEVQTFQMNLTWRYGNDVMLTVWLRRVYSYPTT
jgi:hypothetical protein